MRYVGQKLIQLIIVVVAVTFLTSAGIRFLKPDPVTFITQGAEDTPEAKAKAAQIRADLYLDRPVVVQYVLWIRDLVTGNLGTSINSNTPISTLLSNSLPISLTLMIYAQFLALLFAVPLAMIAAYRANGMLDRGFNVGAFAFLSVPNYILGLFLALIFAVRLGWVPRISENVPLFTDPVDHVRNYALPAVTLAVGLFAGYFRLLRNDLIATLQSDFITMARAKGMSTSRIMFRHALRPSSFSLLTAAAVNIGAIIGGSVIVEQIFRLQGAGFTTVDAIARRDYPTLQAFVAVFAIIFVVANFAVDMLYAVLDPRIRHARALA